MARNFRALDEVIVETLKKDKDFSNEFLEEAFNEYSIDGDQEVLLASLRHIAEAQGFSKLARISGLSRDAFYKCLSPVGNPRLDTIMKILKALNYKLSIQPI